MQPDQAPYFEVFYEEAAEHLQQLQRGLLALKNRPKDETERRATARAADTLMGLALTMGFDEMSQHARHMRDVLFADRDGGGPLASSNLDRLFQSLEAICTLVDTALRAERGDADGNFPQATVMAMRMSLDQLLQGVLRLERQPGDVAIVTDVRPIALALKEHAASCGLDAIAQVAQRTEEVLRVVEEGARTLNEAYVGLLLQGLGFIELWLDAAATGNANDTEVGELCTMLDEILAAVASEDVDMAPTVSRDAPVAAGEEKLHKTPDSGPKVREAEALRENLTVLIASHSTLFSRALSSMISQENHEVILTDNPKGLVGHLKRKDVDLCFLRDTLPNGLDICKQFASEPGDTHAVPIIIYGPLSRLKSTALETGACGFLKVPCQPNEVFALVDRWGRLARRP